MPVQKKKRTQLTQAIKLEIANALHTGSTIDGVVHKYRISRRTAYNIKRNANTIQNLAQHTTTLTSYRQRTAKYPDIEQRLLVFLSTARSMKLPVTANVIKTKAIQIHQKLMEGKNEILKQQIEHFKGSDGWVQKFVKRNGLRSVSLHGQADSVDIQKVAKDIAHLRENLRAFDPEFVFNVDETGLFYRLLPRKTYILEHENRKSVRGTKNMKAKDRITAYICTNATGTLKLPVAIIGTAKSPRCFRKQAPPLPYFSQKNAWSDAPTFRKWFHNVFVPFVRKKTSASVALIMDNCSAHGEVNDIREQVTIFNLPPNCTAVYQPMDCGVIAALKLRYRHHLLSEIIMSFEDREVRRSNASKMAAGTKGLAEGHEPHVLDAMELVVKAWECVSEKSIARCWIKADILPKQVCSDLFTVHGKGKLFCDAEQKDLYEQLCVSFRKLRLCSSSIGTVSTELENITNDDVREWVTIENDPDVQNAIMSDTCQEIMGDCLLSGAEGSDNAEDTSMMNETNSVCRPICSMPSIGAISTLFAPLESVSNNSQLDRFHHLLRAAKRELIDVSASERRKRQRQTTMMEYFQ